MIITDNYQILEFMKQTHWNHENNMLSTAQGQQDPESHLPTQLELERQHCDVEA